MRLAEEDSDCENSLALAEFCVMNIIFFFFFFFSFFFFHKFLKMPIQSLAKGVPRQLNTRNYQRRNHHQGGSSSLMDLKHNPDVAALVQESMGCSQASQDSHISLPITLTSSAGTGLPSYSPLKSKSYNK